MVEKEDSIITPSTQVQYFAQVNRSVKGCRPCQRTSIQRDNLIDQFRRDDWRAVRGGQQRKMGLRLGLAERSERRCREDQVANIGPLDTQVTGSPGGKLYTMWGMKRPRMIDSCSPMRMAPSWR